MLPNQARVTVISIDGMRPDALRRACTPAMDALIGAGVYTFGAKTVVPSVTLPCHTSMWRGVDVPRHGITDNVFHPLARPVPSVFDVAHAQGRTCGMFYNWGELRDLCAPSSLDVSVLVNEIHRPRGDVEVAAAVEQYSEREFDLQFVYLGCTDQVGHDHGWMSDAYLAAIEHADACVARVVAACTASDAPHCFVLLSDHGGHDRTHGTDSQEDTTIPWVASGAGIPHRRIATDVRIFDTAPTVARLMGLNAPSEWDGRAVPEVFAPSDPGGSSHL